MNPDPDLYFNLTSITSDGCKKEVPKTIPFVHTMEGGLMTTATRYIRWIDVSREIFVVSSVFGDSAHHDLALRTLVFLFLFLSKWTNKKQVPEQKVCSLTALVITTINITGDPS